jgi:hypothetical protein
VSQRSGSIVLLLTGRIEAELWNAPWWQLRHDAVMQTSRMEERLSVVASADTSCSVLWLLPDEPAELAGAMARTAASTGLAARGFAGRWDLSATWHARAGEIDAATVVNAEMRIGATRMTGAMLDVGQHGVSGFWPEFGGRVRHRQICAALVPPQAAAAGGGWVQAGLQLVLAAASFQASRGQRTGRC